MRRELAARRAHSIQAEQKLNDKENAGRQARQHREAAKEIQRAAQIAEREATRLRNMDLKRKAEDVGLSPVARRAGS